MIGLEKIEIYKSYIDPKSKKYIFNNWESEWIAEDISSDDYDRIENLIYLLHKLESGLWAKNMEIEMKREVEELKKIFNVEAFSYVESNYEELLKTFYKKG